MQCTNNPERECEFESLGRYIDRSGKVPNVEVVQCRHCGHGVTLPPLADVSFLYAGRASQDFQPDSRKGLAHWIKNVAFRRDARRLLAQMGQTEGTILDFGCGSGQFTQVLGQVHGSGKVTGADMHDEPPAELAGHPYLGATELVNREEDFDSVIAMQVLEHDDDPAKLLSRIASFARPGGKVVIEVPNILCPWNRLFGKYWDAWYLPYHRHHFTLLSLLNQLRLGGLTIVSVRPVTIPTMGRSFANLFGGQNNLFWLIVGIVAHPVQILLERLTGQPTAWRVVTIKVPNAGQSAFAA